MSKVLLLAADNGGCAYYRLRLPAQHSAHDTTVTTELVVGRDMTGQVRDVKTDADTVVLQRIARPWQLDVIRLLHARGQRVIVDMDDDFTCLHPSNPARQAGGAEIMAESCRIADHVTVTTPALAERYAPHGRVTVLPNYVPSAYLLHRTVKDRTVGWSGSVHTHPDDLEVTRGAVGRTVSDFHVIGTGVGVRQALSLPSEPSSTGWVPLEDYPLELGRLRIGIVPLTGTAFNRAKSALKMLEMAATGSVPIVSPTPDNLRLHADGVGLVARRPRDWQRHLEALLNDEGLRLDMVDHARKVIAERHTIEANVWKWDEVWTSTSVPATTRPLAG